MKHVATAFNSGEFSPSMLGRVDIERYSRSARRLQNFLISPQGALYRRPAFRFIREVHNSSKKHILVPFEFNDEQAYVLEFGDNTMRVYKDGGIVLQGVVPYQIATPWSENDLAQLRWAQSADVMYIAHPNHRPKKLTRTGHTSWTITDIEPYDGPYYDINEDTSIVITASGVTGNITLTSSAPVFKSGHVGGIWRLEESAASKHNPWEGNVSYGAGVRVINAGYVYETASGGVSGKRPPVHDFGTESDGGVDWLFLHKGHGFVKITSFISTTQVNATVISRLPNSVTSGTRRWREGAWSDANGWPRAVTFYGERLCFAGTKQQTQTLWLSELGDYESFSPTDTTTKVLDTNAITVTFSSDTVNVIYWLAQQNSRIVIGTNGGEWVLQPPSSVKGLTPDNIELRQHSSWGSEPVASVKVGTSVLYVQRGGNRIREMIYSYEVDAFVSKDLNLLADHILRDREGCKQIVFQQEPLSILWVLSNNGQLLGCSYMRDQEVVGWHRHVIGGNGIVESLAVISGGASGEDELWAIIRRTINGQQRRYVERLEPIYWPANPQDKSGLWHMDSALSLDSATPITTVSGLSHLEGKTVQVVTDGAIHPSKVVTSGSITLDWQAYKVRVGLGFESFLTTNPIDVALQDGTSEGSVRRVDTLRLNLLNSYGLKYGDGLSANKELFFRTPSMPMNQGHDLFTGWVEIYLGQSYVKDGIYTIASNGPSALMILSVVTKLDITN